MSRVNFSEFKQKALSKPEVKSEYDRLAPEYELRGQLINARMKAGLTQEEVAQRMGTTKSAVCRLESVNSKNSPSIQTLLKYAQAVGSELKIAIK
ncbi:MAG: helix-turn-helix domain-containing protein [Deferribacterales bacterium]